VTEDAGHPSYLRLGLTGWPLGHSLSPRLQTAALAAAGLQGEYALYPVPPLPDGAAALSGLLDDLRQGRLDGLNVTIPHKQSVLPALDELSPAAQAIGAANTLYARRGKLIGENTDAPGFLADLERLGFLSGSRRALILGAGGSARAVCFALIGAGWQVTVTARRLEQAQALAAGLAASSATLQAAPFEPSALTRPFSLIINTTPLGMTPNVDASPWPDGLPFPASTAVYDLVYNPAETGLVKAARAAGLCASTGLGMLVEQAALSFELWTGHNVSRAALWQALGVMIGN
jgi:shikimate dehydrogenase